MLDGVFGVTVVCTGVSETDSHTGCSALNLTDSLLCFTVLVWVDSFHGLFYPLIAVISSIHNSCRLHRLMPAIDSLLPYCSAKGWPKHLG